jgi:Uma2 family endonuclease
MVVQVKFYTADDLWEISHLPENAEKRFELSEGMLIEMSPTGGKHGGVAFDFGLLIGSFVREHDLGYMTAAETGFILYKNPHGKDTVRALDIGFVAKERLPDGLPDGYVPLAPDLAIEVVSPNDDASEVQQKVMEYLRYGVRLVWVAYPRTKSVVAHTKMQAITVDIDGILDGGDVLPGFRLPVREIFG